MKNYDVVINGRVLDFPMNGIPRYALETIKSIDSKNINLKIAVVIPENSNFYYQFKSLDLIKLPNSKLWDYCKAEKFAKKNTAIYVNMANKGTLYKNSVLVFHDVRPLDKKYGDSFKHRFLFSISFFLARLNSKVLVVDSTCILEQVKKKVKNKRIEVIGNGWEHFFKLQPNNMIFEKYPELLRNNYYFTVGSIAPHKNFKWVIENAKYNPYSHFVIAGGINHKLWKETIDESTNVIFVGYQSDETIKALMKHSKAFIFPSLYEGFGIPPLEALSIGKSCFCSDIPVFKEIYGDSVQYINPFDPNISLDIEIKPFNVVSSKNVLLKNTWENAGIKWLSLLNELTKTQ